MNKAFQTKIQAFYSETEAFKFKTDTRLLSVFQNGTEAFQVWGDTEGRH